VTQGGSATLLRMEPLEAISKATREYRKTEEAHAKARQAVIDAVLAALRAGKGPTEVTGRSPFTAAYVRRIARENGIEPASPGPKPQGH
jgi:hypothetical protein